ncbi:uncharacterized protein SCODWIG_00519 [Saccharomycodes ludwigii]|uniref:Spt20-like SEP domain-containing protein n=1 Tax=Saccharomycodes ludwigii TaxID=36035 RepID=A0A376B248_9ASCO|nr:uncharacterized protein SCODWIG_00519 [Saccharomycodes ludwigii]
MSVNTGIPVNVNAQRLQSLQQNVPVNSDISKTNNNLQNGVKTGIQSNNGNPTGTPTHEAHVRNARAAQNAQQQRMNLANYEQQFLQLMTTLNKKPRRLYNFTEETDAILKKYEQFRTSFELHIYDNTYKICAPANSRLQQHFKNELSGDGLILNKNNETFKDFLENVARGIIPASIMDVLKDCNIQFYEGNLILQVYDHTNTVDIKPPQQNHPSIPKNVSPIKSDPFNATGNNVPAQTNTKRALPVLKRPRVYRTLLRPNDLTRYYDMMVISDQSRFSDGVYQQLESEILTLTKRNLNLKVPLNPFENKDLFDDKQQASMFLEPSVNENCEVIQHHRELCSNEDCRGLNPHMELREELPHNSSSFEEMMLMLNDRTINSTLSTYAATIAKKKLLEGGKSRGTVNNNGSMVNNTPIGSSSVASPITNNTNSNAKKNKNNIAIAAAATAAAMVAGEGQQFGRLKFIENWRINNEKRKQDLLKNKNNLANNSDNVIMNPANGEIISDSNKISMVTPEQKKLLQKTAQQQKRGTRGPGKGRKANSDAKPRAKRVSKKAATANSGKEGEAKPKRKRGPNKKKAAKKTETAATTSAD